MATLGYSLSVNFINASDLGVPQNRPRLFIIATRSRNPVDLQLPEYEKLPARSFVDLNPDKYTWGKVADRVEATRVRVENGRKQFGDIFLDAAYGSAKTGRSLDKPLGAVTTVNKHSLVIGDTIRPLSIAELAAAQSFRGDYLWPESVTATKRMIGNAVPPLMAQRLVETLMRTI